MIQAIKRSISRKIMLLVLATTLTALLVSAIVSLLYDMRTYQKSLVNDLVTQADLLGRVSAPALEFADPKAAQENLAALRVRPMVTQAALYAPNGQLFASYFRAGNDRTGLPKTLQPEGFRIEGDRIAVFHHVADDRDLIGTVYLEARYGQNERLKSYLLILAAMTATSLVVALGISSWLQAAVTKPILAVADGARDVMQRRDFSVRVEKTTDDEIGLLVDAFNDMLHEVGQRSQALLASNRTLQEEMQERRAAEEALLAADRRKDEFLATLAHELRNPLAPLSNSLAILRLAGGNETAASAARSIMERQLKQMVRLVDDLLDVSRISTGKLALRAEPVVLQAVVSDAVETVSPLIEARSHTLDVALPEQPVHLRGDATRLAQVFANLLGNAAKYTDPGGRISFGASTDGAQAIVKVADNGIGIPPHMLGNIFNMFTQVDGSLERTQAGLGVGLSLARHLIELHGGTIEVHSGGTGQGSTFIVRLPLTPPVDAPEPAKDDGAIAPAGPRHRILLADDNVDFAGTMATLLREMGHEVRVVHDGLAALEAAGAFQPEFAFCDIGMPKLNGYDLARRLRALPALQHTVLVAITGWGQEHDRERAHAAGFDRHVVKPITFEQLLSLLEVRRSA